MLDKCFYQVKNKEDNMSKYTEYLNNHPDIDYKTFLKIYAWSMNALKNYEPKELSPLEDTLPVDTDDMLAELNKEQAELDRLTSLTEDQKNKIIAEETNHRLKEHQENIDKQQKLIMAYTNIISDLCRWSPEDREAKALKESAIKELNANMPNLSKFSNLNTIHNSKGYFDKLMRDSNAKINILTSKISTADKNRKNANICIENLLTEIEFAPDPINSKAQEEEIKEETFNFIKI